MKNRSSVKALAIITLFFLVSILIRLPNINRPLSKHHEFITAIALQVITIWQEKGAATYNFNPVMTYQGAGNKYINKFASTTGKMRDSSGNFYYVSHPPFAYIFPYLVFKLLRIKADVLSIEIFNLVINFISALLVYFIIISLREKQPSREIDFYALSAFGFYLFSPAVLWFQCNTYMSDILVHLFFVSGIYLLLQFYRHKRLPVRYFILYGINLFLMVYTSWLGIFFAASVSLFSIIRLRKQKFFKGILLTTFIATVASIAVFAFQYSLISGFETYLDQMTNRLELRSGWEATPGLGKIKKTIYLFGRIIFNYITGYLPAILLIIFLSFNFIKAKTEERLRTKSGFFIFISIFPVLLLHSFLSEYSGHDFTALYASVFLSVALALLFQHVSGRHLISRAMRNTLIASYLLVSIGIYYFINRPGKLSMKGDDYSLSKQLGLEIKNTANDSAVVFSDGNALIDPQLMYYARRNIKEVASRQEALDFLRTCHLKEGIIYYSSNPEKTSFDRIETIYLNEK